MLLAASTNDERVQGCPGRKPASKREGLERELVDAFGPAFDDREDGH